MSSKFVPEVGISSEQVFEGLEGGQEITPISSAESSGSPLSAFMERLLLAALVSLLMGIAQAQAQAQTQVPVLGPDFSLEAQNGEPLPVVPPPASAPLPPPPPLQTYVAGPGDRFQIDVFESPEYSGEFEVMADGSLRMPFVGAVQVRGLTLDQISRQLSQQYSAILRRPLVSVRLLEARPVMLAVVGEVNRPGTYRIASDDVEGLPTVTQAIQLAGGITQSADIRQIKVERENPVSRGAGETVTVDLWKLLQEADLRQDVALQDGDRIIIPEATGIGFEEAAELANANFSPAEMNVYVVGEVGAPGAVLLPPNTPLNQALLAAGGFTNRSRRGRVELVRLNSNGTVTRRTIEVDLSADASEDTNPPLRPNDTVIVNRSTFTRVTDVLARALGPFTGLVSFFRILGL